MPKTPKGAPPEHVCKGIQTGTDGKYLKRMYCTVCQRRWTES
jgi:hypothetical protein